jgi:CBS domain containing-hemolysin-like protein
MSSEPAILLGLTIVLVAIAWFLVAGETALSRLSRARVEESVAEGNRRAQKLLPITQDPARYVNALLLTHSVVTLTALATLAFALIAIMDTSTGWAVVAATAIMSVVSYVVLGVSARTVGRQHPYTIAAAAVGPAKALAVILTPVSSALILLGNAITPGRGYREGPFASQAELRELVDAAEAASVIEDDERQMIHSVFELGGTIAREVMVPRTEMVFIERDKKLRQGLSLGLRSGFSRIPVIGTDTDDVVGLVYLKDLVRRVFEHRDAEHLEQVDSLMRPAHFVPDSKPADELLREMQANRAHMAIVVDEFGGTAGIVTIEDILEEIVGEIADEYDTDEPDVVRLPDGRLRLSARLSLEHFSDVTGVDLDPDAEGVETIGGLLGKRLGRVPIPGAAITEQSWRLVAESSEGRRNRISTILAARTGEHQETVEG